MLLTIGITRHFQTDWNAEHLLQGRTDRPLTDEARARAKALSIPPPWDEARLIATPLSRARDTGLELAYSHMVDDMVAESFEGFAVRQIN